MVFNEDLLFIHNGKTGGSSCAAYLLENLDGRIYNCDAEQGSVHADNIVAVSSINRHCTLRSARNHLLREFDKDIFSFKKILVCIRHPYTLEVSFYQHLQKPEIRERRKGNPELLELVKDMTDDQIMALARGGHDSHKVYNAYHQAVNTKGRPTVILAQTVKGYGMGTSGEAINKTHSVKALDIESLKKFRDRFELPISDEDLPKLPYYRPAEDSPEMQYMKSRRKELKGFIPSRNASFDPLLVPALDAFAAQLSYVAIRSANLKLYGSAASV